MWRLWSEGKLAMSEFDSVSIDDVEHGIEVLDALDAVRDGGE